MSERVERKIVAMLGDVQVSPYGNPVPGLEELGVEPPDVDAAAEQARASLADHPDAAAFVLERIGEPLQVDHEVLARMAEAGVRPGRTVQVERSASTLTLRGEGGAVDLDADLAAFLFGVPA